MMRSRPATLATLVACAGTGAPQVRTPEPARAPDVATSAGEATGYPGTLRRPSRLGEDFLLRHSVEARFSGKTLRLSAVLQKQGDALVLVGLTPFGSRAFTIEQHGDRIAFTSHMGRDLPLSPRDVLLDLQRIWFAWLPEAANGAPRSDGEHEAIVHGERVVERWAGARLRERRFSRLDGRPRGEIHITYEGGMPPGGAPARVRFVSGWYGYEYTLYDLDRRPLPPAPARGAGDEGATPAR